MKLIYKNLEDTIKKQYSEHMPSKIRQTTDRYYYRTNTKNAKTVVSPFHRRNKVEFSEQKRKNKKSKEKKKENVAGKTTREMSRI